MEDAYEICRKRIKYIPCAEDIKRCIFNTKEPLILRNILSWNLLKWTLQDWTEQLENPTVDVRMGTTQCTKVPQWEGNCEVVSASLKDLLDEENNRLNGKWMYFDYKHMKQYFGKKSDLLESISWSDFGFPDKNGKDSTIWIGTKGAHTPCHIDSYGCNIVGQVYGRKQWVMFPPSETSALKLTRVPYEESSIYSNIHFACGLNVPHCLREARVVELSPGDVLIVPKHWWHYVENLTTAISINMWIPKESDHASRLEESLVRYFVGVTLKNLGAEEGTSLLNPNEMDLLDEPVDIRQISFCVDQALVHQMYCEEAENIAFQNHQGTISFVPSLTAKELRILLLNKCGCVEKEDNFTETQKCPKLSKEDVINAFCHPDVIAKVAEMLISSRNS